MPPDRGDTLASHAAWDPTRALGTAQGYSSSCKMEEFLQPGEEK